MYIRFPLLQDIQRKILMCPVTKSKALILELYVFWLYVARTIVLDQLVRDVRYHISRLSFRDNFPEPILDRVAMLAQVN